MRGEGLKVEIYKNQVQAYDTQVNSAATKAQMLKIDADNDIEKAKLELSVYVTQLEQYKAELGAEVARMQSVVLVGGQSVSQYSAVIEAYKALGALDASSSELFFNILNANDRMALAQKELMVNDLLQRVTLNLSATQTGADVFKLALASIYDINNKIAVTDGTT
jgi:hypothetical protein